MDALALEDDEGRDYLRKATGNGGTRCELCHIILVETNNYQRRYT